MIKSIDADGRIEGWWAARRISGFRCRNRRPVWLLVVRWPSGRPAIVCRHGTDRPGSRTRWTGAAYLHNYNNWSWQNTVFRNENVMIWIWSGSYRLKLPWWVWRRRREPGARLALKQREWEANERDIRNNMTRWRFDMVNNVDSCVFSLHKRRNTYIIY